MVMTLAVIYEVNIQPTSSSAIDSVPWIWSKAAFGSEMVTACMIGRHQRRNNDRAMAVGCRARCECGAHFAASAASAAWSGWRQVRR